MASQVQPDIAFHIVERAKYSGASLAGITGVAALQNSPSHRTRGKVEWPAGAKSVLVLALAHKETEPKLDWWGVPGGTAGNHRLQVISEKLEQYLSEEFGIQAQLLPYQPGVFLKDAGALAGLGVIGANNLLITPGWGPCVRLRALLLDVELSPTGPMDFSPCNRCDRLCWQACPQQAFASGSYSRKRCNRQMQEDEKNRRIVEEAESEDLLISYVRYCRACELACPVGER